MENPACIKQLRTDESRVLPTDPDQSTAMTMKEAVSDDDACTSRD